MTKRAVIITTSIIVAIVASLTILFGFVFRVQNILVVSPDDFKYKNNTSQILKASSVGKNDSIFNIDRNKVAENIEKEFPYARVVAVNLSATSVKIKLTNRTPLYHFVENEIYYILDEDCKVLEKLTLDNYNERGLNLIQLTNVFSAGESVAEGQFMQNKYTNTCSQLYKALYSNAMLNIGEDIDVDGIADEKYLDREDMCDVIDSLEFKQEYELSGQVDKLVMTTSHGCKISIIEPSKQMGIKINMAFSALRALIADDNETGENKSTRGIIAIRYSYGENNTTTPVAEYYNEQ